MAFTFWPVANASAQAPAPSGPKPPPLVQVEPLPHHQARFVQGDRELTRYHFDPADRRSFLYPLTGPSGLSLTRMGHPRDPMGNAIELFYGPVKDRKFVSPAGMEFVAGALGVGHINLLAAPLVAARDFYTRVLGFRLTDFIRFGPGDSANFFHCNARHHSIGLLKVGDLAGVHHLMLEARDIDMVGRCLQRVEEAGIPITSTLGRHANDRMLSFYMASPFGFEVEIGCEGVRVDEHWTPSEFVEGDIWGHRGLDPETIQRNLAAMGA